MVDLYEKTRDSRHRLLCLIYVPCLQICPSVAMSAQGIKGSVAAPQKVRDERPEGRLKEAISQAHRVMLGGLGGPGSMGSFHFDWDMDAMPAGDRVGWELWEQASYLYLLVRNPLRTLTWNVERPFNEGDA